MAKKMSKKAEDEKSDEKKDPTEVAMKAIRSKYGDIIKSGSQLFDPKVPKKCLSVSPAYDHGLNGGIQEGSWTIITGIPKIGKTTVTLQIMANGHSEGRKSIYVNAENRLKEYNLDGIHNLNKSEMEIIGGGDKDLAGEDFLNSLDTMIRLPKFKGCVVAVDSTSSLLPRAELEADVSGMLRANLPKMLSHWIKKNAQTVVRNDIIMILITHFITNTSGYGKQKLADCGVMVQYQADTRIEFSKVEPWEENGKKIGQKTQCEIGCSSMGASGTSVTSYIRYGYGIDSIKECTELAESFGLIMRGDKGVGAWYTMPFLKELPDFVACADQKFQGTQKVYDFIKENESVANYLKKEIPQYIE